MNINTFEIQCFSTDRPIHVHEFLTANATFRIPVWAITNSVNFLTVRYASNRHGSGVKRNGDIMRCSLDKTDWRSYDDCTRVRWRQHCEPDCAHRVTGIVPASVANWSAVNKFCIDVSVVSSSKLSASWVTVCLLTISDDVRWLSVTPTLFPLSWALRYLEWSQAEQLEFKKTSVGFKTSYQPWRLCMAGITWQRRRYMRSARPLRRAHSRRWTHDN